MANSGFIFDIKRFEVHDGPGIRTTVFFKGCPLRCWWCHNPEGMYFSESVMYFEYKCIGCRTCENVCPLDAISFNFGKHHIDRLKCSSCGICCESCPSGALTCIGRAVTVDELMTEIQKDVLLYDNSEGGVTFSGGEPLVQYEFLTDILKECRKLDIHTALDTSGYAPEDVFAHVAENVDIFLYDLKLADNPSHIIYTGVSNELIKKNLKMLADSGRGGDVILRFPVIPGITDTQENVEGLAEFISTLDGIKEIDLLPFHDITEKYTRLGMKYNMSVQTAPSKENLKYIKKKFEQLGLYVKL